MWATFIANNENIATTLLELWLQFARRVVCASLLLSVMLVIIVSLSWMILNWWWTGVLAAVVLAVVGVARCGPVHRLPGLLSVEAASRLIPWSGDRARWYTYLCSANVTVSPMPATWQWDALGVFVIAPSTSICCGRGRGRFSPS